MARRTVRLGTRGSDLALRQAAEVEAILADRRYDVDLVEVTTRGDELRDELIHQLGTTGAFVRTLDERVLAGDLDAAVHSMKDVPTDTPADLVIAAIPERGKPEDVLVTPDGTPLDDLPEGALVGTASLRRQALLKRRRPDLAVEPLRGNVDTRVEKLLAPSLQREHERRLAAERPETGDEGDADTDTDSDTSTDVDSGPDADTDSQAGDQPTGGDAAQFDRSVSEWVTDLTEIERRALERQGETEFDAIVLAAAGLERIGLGRDLSYEELPITEFVPAPGQGSLAVSAIDGELATRLNDVLDHPRSRVETTVERTVLATLGGGCVAPIGVHAVVQGEDIRTSVAVLDQEGRDAVTLTRHLPVERHAEAATALAHDLDDQGARELIERARRDEPDEAKRG